MFAASLCDNIGVGRGLIDLNQFELLSVGDRVEENSMTESLYPPSTSDIRKRRRALAPDVHLAFDAFSRAAFADGALSAKMKQIVAVAVAHVTQCPYCIEGHTKAARRAGATPEELMEAVWVAAEMRAGGAFAHSTIMLNALDHDQSAP